MSSSRPDLSATMALALQHHQAGRLAQAAQLYQEVISREPRHADALRLLGVISHQFGKHELAVDLLRSAIEINPKIAEYHSNLGLALHALGRFEPAIAAFQAALQLQPKLAEAHYNLANTLRAAGQIDNAIASYQLALELQPNYPQALNNLGTALKDQGRFEQAVKAFHAAVQFQPNFAGAWSNLGNALQLAGEFDDAIAAYQSALRLKADDAQTLNNLGSAHAAQRQFESAIAYYQMALRIDPQYAEAHFNLGNLYKENKRLDDAAAAYRTALALQPNYPQAHLNLGNTLQELKQLEPAIAAYRAAIALDPTFAEAHNNLGTALKDQPGGGLLDDAIASFRTALQLKLDYAEAWSNFGSALKDQGLMDDAIAAFRKAVEHRPAAVELHNNLIYALHFHHLYDPREVAGELTLWNARHAVPLARQIQPLAIDPNPSRPLRIGFVSPDFRSHPIGRFLLPLFSAHDPSDSLFFCYSDVPPAKAAQDTITQKLRSHADRWHHTASLTDKELAALIRLDHVDILVDLTMHMAGSRLLTFAQKPAPLQITYLAYVSSTGLEAMDYRLTDSVFDPSNAGILPAASEPTAPTPPALSSPSSPYTERPLHLASYWCYPPPDNAPPVSPLPALTAGHVTFACLNNFAKVSPKSLTLWIEILRKIPHSRLLLHAAPGSHRDRTRALLSSAGLDPARLDFVGFLPFQEYLALHHTIDIALDPYPYAGGTTSCDALFMGVPFITYAGPHALSRGGASLLTQLQLQQLIAPTPKSYLDTAINLSQNLSQLRNLRTTLRDRLQSSLLMNAPAFAQNFQSTLRQAWQASLRP